MTEIKLFKFDSKTDYLPYYKTYTLELNETDTIRNVLETIYDIEKFGYISDESFFIRVNNLFISADESITSILDDLEDDLLIEPISVKRAVNDLIIDIKDYQNKLDLLDGYLENEQKVSILEHKTYMLDYYASNTLHFNDDYIGDHVLLLASELVRHKPELREKLSTLVNGENGVKLHSSLKYRMLGVHSADSVVYTNATLDAEVLQLFSNFNISLYCGLNDSSFENVIQKSEATYIDLKSKHFDIPLTSKELSYLMAGTILLEAKDNNADFLIVNDNEELKLFDSKQKSIEKTMGREINLPVLTQNEFVQLLQGNTNLDSHKVKLSFLDS